MNKRDLLLLVIATGVNAILCFAINSYQQPKVRIAYVKADVLFNDFEMTKELKVNYENTVNARRHVLDSLIMLVKVSSKDGNAKLAEAAEKDYFIKKDRFDEQNQELTQQYDDQVWMRINQYVKEYGEKNKIGYLLGANGNGSLMYSAEENDVTKAVLEYMNKSYKGNTK